MGPREHRRNQWLSWNSPRIGKRRYSTAEVLDLIFDDLLCIWGIKSSGMSELQSRASPESPGKQDLREVCRSEGRKTDCLVGLQVEFQISE